MQRWNRGVVALTTGRFGGIPTVSLSHSGQNRIQRADFRRKRHVTVVETFRKDIRCEPDAGVHHVGSSGRGVRAIERGGSVVPATRAGTGDSADSNRPAVGETDRSRSGQQRRGWMARQFRRPGSAVRDREGTGSVSGEPDGARYRVRSRQTHQYCLQRIGAGSCGMRCRRRRPDALRILGVRVAHSASPRRRHERGDGRR